MMLKITIINDGTANKEKENIAYPPDGVPFCIIGNYDYKVYVNTTLVGEGRIEGHNRLTGWEGLVSCLNMIVNGSKFEV